VPAKIWSPFAGSPIRYNGDGPAFHAVQGTSRAEAEVSFRLDADTFALTEQVGPSHKFGMTKVYLATSSHDVPGKPLWWKEEDTQGAAPLVQKTMKPDDGTFDVSVVQESNRVVVQFRLSAQPYFPWDGLPKELEIPVLTQLSSLLAEFANPDFDADISVTIANMGDGSPRYIVAGTHDRFPAYAVFINEERVYVSDEAKLEQVLDVNAALTQQWPVLAEPFRLLKKP
jgi:hypothetical protein